MNESLTGINNIVVYVDDDPVTNEMQYGSATQKGFQHNLIDNFFYNSIIRAHSLNEVLRDNILKKDFERASKLLNDFRSGNLAASEVFDIDKLAIWLAMTDLFGANHRLRSGQVLLEVLAIGDDDGSALELDDVGVQLEHYASSVIDVDANFGERRASVAEIIRPHRVDPGNDIQNRETAMVVGGRSGSGAFDDDIGVG